MTKVPALQTNTPILPSAKPHKGLALALLLVSAIGLLTGLGLGGSAVTLYMQTASMRLEQSDHLSAIERNAEIRQKEAQLKRDYSAPVWIATQTYAPNVTYQVEGVRAVDVPVLLGPQLDTAVCIGSMGPKGFIQNVNSPLCVGY